MKLATSFLFVLALGTPALAEDFAPVALNSLTAVPARIIAAPVLDMNDAIIGKVRAVATDQDGHPSALSYVAGRHLMIVAAPAVSYDAQKNIVVIDTNKARLDDRVALN